MGRAHRKGAHFHKGPPPYTREQCERAYKQGKFDQPLDSTPTKHGMRGCFWEVNDGRAITVSRYVKGDVVQFVIARYLPHADRIVEWSI